MQKYLFFLDPNGSRPRMVCKVWCLVVGEGGGVAGGYKFNHFNKQTALLLLFHQHYIILYYTILHYCT